MQFKINQLLFSFLSLACIVRALPFSSEQPSHSDLAITKRFPAGTPPDTFTAKFGTAQYHLTRMTSGTTGVVYRVQPHFTLQTGQYAAVAKTIATKPKWNPSAEATNLGVAEQFIWYGADQTGRNWLIMKDMEAYGYRSLDFWIRQQQSVAAQKLILQAALDPFVDASVKYLEKGLLYADVNSNNIFLTTPQPVVNAQNQLTGFTFADGDFIDFDPEGVPRSTMNAQGGTSNFKKSRRIMYRDEMKATYPHLFA
ncbi:hypothetical protein K435DRAFT_866826 [Dendrothele bispora CBS 962.96]|uniref:Protein kinase domain-containing protein n=1 Tax=Dendrothele bispora (strain CBS 962.96) TaxID=1314807 RepID=A0A4S8LFW9_DENBC|nr:hypothetical protein K435DRAFT_866826 [Dendrothele bispora CBS 962.96]